MNLTALVAVLSVHAPYRPHAVVGVVDASAGLLRLQFTEPATDAEVAHIVDLLSDYVPLPVYVETVHTKRPT